MKAAIFYGPEDIRIEEIPIPECTCGGAVLKLKGSLICGTDAKIFKSGHPKIKPPQIIGHECCGEIVSLESTNTNLKVGDRVTLQTSIPCGRCEMCKRGIFNLCESIKAISWEYPGTFAEYAAIPRQAIDTGNLIRVPDNLRDEEACLAEPLACVINGQSLLDIQPGQSVLIIGAGPIGILHAELAKRSGAGDIIMAERSKNRIQTAERFHYSYYIDTGEENLTDRIMEITNGRGVDIAIVTAPVQQVQQEAVKSLAVRGKLSLFGSLGTAASDISIDTRLIHYKEIGIFGASSSTAYQMEQALKILSSGGIDTGEMITHTLPLEKLVDGINMSIHGEGLKIYIKNGHS